MKALILVLSLCSSLILTSCAQKLSNIRGFAFYQESIPGREMRGIDGIVISRPHDTLHTIYLETKKTDSLVIESIFFFGKKISPAVYEQSINDPFLGVRKTDGSRVELSQVNDKKWWRIELNPIATKGKRKKGVILIKGRQGRKPFQLTFSKETELKPQISG